MLTQRGEQFVRDLHTHRWIRNIEPAGWHETARARELEAEDDPYALDDATPEELSRLLTVCMALDTIMDSQHLLACCKNGWFLRVVRRADALLRELPPEDRATLMP